MDRQTFAAMQARAQAALAAGDWRAAETALTALIAAVPGTTPGAASLLFQRQFVQSFMRAGIR